MSSRKKKNGGVPVLRTFTISLRERNLFIRRDEKNLYTLTHFEYIMCVQNLIFWFQSNYKGIIFIVLLIISSIIVNKIFKNEDFKKFWNGYKDLLKKIRSATVEFLGFVFFITLIASIFLHILKPEVFPNFVSNLAIAALALGAFTIAMANLINTKRICEESIRYKLLAEDFISAGIYFIFSYFFWLVVVYNEKTTSKVLESIVSVYSILTVIALLCAIILMISGMWKFINENN